MLTLFEDMCEAIDNSDAEAKKQGFKIRYGQIRSKADKENPLPPTGKHKSKSKVESRRLQNALNEKRDIILRPLEDPSIPPTNNLAERSFRMLKVKQKVSGGFRNSEHGGFFATIASYVETAKRNGIGVFKAITDAVAGTPHIPGIID